MATDRKSARSGFRLRWLLLLLPGCCALALLAFHSAPRDKNGNRPRAVAKAFVEAVQLNDFRKAASFWKSGTPQIVEANFEMKFEDFCVRVFKCDSYDLGVTTRQKERSYKVPFRGMLNGREKTFGLYLQRVDGEWRIIEELWISGTDNSEKTDKTD